MKDASSESRVAFSSMENARSAGTIHGSLFTAAGKHGLLGFSVPETLGGPAVDDFRYNAIAVVVAKLSRQAIRPLATAPAL